MTTDQIKVSHSLLPVHHSLSAPATLTHRGLFPPQDTQVTAINQSEVGPQSALKCSLETPLEYLRLLPHSQESPEEGSNLPTYHSVSLLANMDSK